MRPEASTQVGGLQLGGGFTGFTGFGGAGAAEAGATPTGTDASLDADVDGGGGGGSSATRRSGGGAGRSIADGSVVDGMAGVAECAGEGLCVSMAGALSAL